MPKKTSNLDRLRAKPSRLDLTIPGDDAPSTYLMIKGSYSHSFIDSVQHMAETVEDMSTMAEVAQARAVAYAEIVVDWDESTFGEYSKETVIEVLSEEELSWIFEFLEDAVKQTATFHSKPTKQSK